MQEPAPPIAPRSRPPARLERRRAHTGLGLLLAGPLLGLLLVGILSLSTINDVRVGGPQDARVTQAHDLVADTTTPSQNLASLRGTLLQLPLAVGSADEAALRGQVDEAESRYREGHAYWDSHLTDPSLRDSLLVEAHEPVATLFRVVHEELWPTMDHGRRSDATEIVQDDLLPLLDRHDAAMRRVSVQAADLLTTTHQRTDDAITLRTRIFMGVLAAVMVLVAIAAVAALRLTRRDDVMIDDPGAEVSEVAAAGSPAPVDDGAEADDADPADRAAADHADADTAADAALEPAPTLAAALELRPTTDAGVADDAGRDGERDPASELTR